MRMGFGIGMGPVIRGKSGPAYDPAATALFARMTVQPDNTRKALINTLITSLKANGIWASLDALYVMAAHDAQAARLNWVQDLYNLTAVNSPTFTVDRGYAGDGSSSYLSTGLSPGIGGLQFVQNSAHFSVYDRTTRGGTAAYQAGQYDGTAASIIQTRSTTDLFGIDVNDGAALPTVANTSNPGDYAAERSVAASVVPYKNGTGLGALSITSTTPAGTQPIYILGLNLSGSLTGPTSDQIAAATIGASLGATKQGQRYTAMQAYMTGVGANV